MKNAPDFEEKSKYVPTGDGKREMDVVATLLSGELGGIAYKNSGYGDLLYEWINGNEDAGLMYRSEVQRSAATSSGAIGAVWSSMTEGEWQAQHMTEDEVAMFNYIYATEGQSKAHQYYEYLRSAYLNGRYRQAEEAEWIALAAKEPVGASIFNVAVAPAKSVSYMMQLEDYIADGRIDQNAPYNRPTYTSMAITEETSKQLEEKWGKIGSAGFRYAMGLAEYAYTYMLTGNKWGALAISATGAAAETTTRAKDRGLSDDQAFALGTVAGTAQLVMEKINLDELLDVSRLGKNALTYWLRSANTAGLEEAGEDLINLFADIMISGDESYWRKSVEAYKAQGNDEVTAWWKAFSDQAISVGASYLGGTVGGSIAAGMAIGGKKLVGALTGTGASMRHPIEAEDPFMTGFNEEPSDWEREVTLDWERIAKDPFEAQLWADMVEEAVGGWYDVKNIGTDHAEYQRLSSVLKERMPSLESFLEMKYNDKNAYQAVLDEYEIGHMYEVQGDIPATKVLEMDQVAFETKRNGFDYTDFHGDERTNVKNLSHGGNAATMELDGELYFSHSGVGCPGTAEYQAYKGSSQLIPLATDRVFQVLDLGDGVPRIYDTEAKFLEYVASVKHDPNEAFTVTILSEKHICKSCLFVVEQFKARYPNATVNIVSGNPAHGEPNSKGEMGMLHWKHR